MRAADVGLTFITVVAGLLLEHGVAHATVPDARSPVAPVGPGSVESGASDHRLDLPATGRDVCVVVVAGSAPSWSAVRLSTPRPRAPRSVAARPSHLPRGPPAR